MFNNLLQAIIDKGASDLHIQSGINPRMRVQGKLLQIDNSQIMTPQMIHEVLKSVMSQQQYSQYIENKELDFSLAYGNVARFRVNAFFEKQSPAIVFRLIPTKIPKLEDLNLPNSIANFTNIKQGLVLFVGPTGTGKSTSLASLINKINIDRSERIVTIEDPIEFLHSNINSVIAQRELGVDTMSFPKALKSVLREDIDVVLIGEMRDLDTIAAAMTIAETGHLVFATLHTNSAAQTIDRIIDVFPSGQQGQIRSQLASVLKGIVSQRLIPSLVGGREVAFEVLIMNSAIKNLIREQKTHQIDSAISTSVEQGMSTLDHSLIRLVKSGKISYEVALSYSINPKELDKLKYA